MIYVNSPAVAVEPAVHGIEKRLQIEPDMMFDQSSNTRRDRCRIPRHARGAAGILLRHLPIRDARQVRAESAQKVAVQDRARTLVEAEPDQSIALFVGDGGIAERKQ